MSSRRTPSSRPSPAPATTRRLPTPASPTAPPARAASAQPWDPPDAEPRNGKPRDRRSRWIRLRLEVLVLGDELAGDEGRPLRVLDHRHPRPRGIERAGDDLAAELTRLGRR